MRPARCVVVAGPGGSGCSTYAARLARVMQDAGRPVLLLGTDPFADATALVDRARGAESTLAPMRTAADLPRGWDESDGVAPGGVDGLLLLAGLEPRLAPELAQLSETGTMRALVALTHLRQDETAVIDAGTRGPDLARLASAAPWTLARMAPAHRGWLSSVRPLAAVALGATWPGQEWSDRARAGLRAMIRVRETLLGQGSAGLVIAGDVPVSKVRRVVVGLALNAAPVTAVCSAERRMSAGLDEVQRAGLPVLRGAGSRALAKLDERARQGSVGDIEWTGAAGTDGDDTDEYSWRMPLPWLSTRELRLSMVQDDLILEALGHRSVLPVPTVMRRCRPVGATLKDGVLGVRFVGVRQDEARDRG